MEPRWRVGRTLVRTLYRDGQCVGMVDTLEVAAEIVAALNGSAPSDLEKHVIDAARLVLLGWVGDSVDGGAAMQDALGRLRAAFEILESSCRCGHGLLRHEDNDHTGGACLEDGCDCNEYER